MTLRHEKLSEAAAKKLLVHNNFPLLYLSGKWDEVVDKDKIQKWMYQVFIKNSATHSMYLWGDVGTGKSTIAGLMALVLCRNFYGDIIFSGCAEMISEIYRNSHTNKYKTSEVLVLDDLGKEYHHEYGVSRLHEVIEYRYSRLLTTIITSNSSQLELIERTKNSSTSGLWRSMLDRLRDEKWIRTRKVAGKSKRVITS